MGLNSRNRENLKYLAIVLDDNVVVLNEAQELTKNLFDKCDDTWPAEGISALADLVRSIASLSESQASIVDVLATHDEPEKPSELEAGQ